MANTLSKDEKFVRDQLTKIYPQLQKNMYKVCGDAHWRWGDDLLAVAVTFFLEKPLEDQLKTIKNNKLENFITWIANMQLKSSSSKFFSVYRKPNGQYRELYEDYKYIIEENESNEDLLQCIENQLNNIPELYKNVILDILYKHKTMSEYQQELELGTITFKKTVNQYLTQIQRKCQHCI
jgi:hypothetical protein